MTQTKKEIASKVSLSIPKSILEEIDNLCAARFVTRSHWFLQAAVEKLDKERFEKSKALLKRLGELEN